MDTPFYAWSTVNRAIQKLPHPFHCSLRNNIQDTINDLTTKKDQKCCTKEYVAVMIDMQNSNFNPKQAIEAIDELRKSKRNPGYPRIVGIQAETKSCAKGTLVYNQLKELYRVDYLVSRKTIKNEIKEIFKELNIC
jgi:hypothetical protein